MADPTTPDAAVRLGREVSARLQPMHQRRRTRIAPEHRAGVVAAKATRFGFLNGRSILARRMLGQDVSARVDGTNLLPVGMQLDLWLAIAERERERMRPTPSRLEQNMQTAQRRAVQRRAPQGFAAEAAAAGPRGLPRATSRGRLSPAGIDTGPSSASHRMVTEAAFVANPDEVRAAGPMLGRRDLARAVARRSTVGPPSPPTGGGRARRSAQASGPGRQVGATRPDGGPLTSAVFDAPIQRQTSTSSSTSASAAAPAPLTTAAPTEAFAPRAMSLPPTALAGTDVEPSLQWQPLPRPGALARRGVLAGELRRVPRDLPRSRAGLGAGVASITTAAAATSSAMTASPALNTRSLAVAPTIESATTVAAANASRLSSTDVHPHDGSVTSVHSSRREDVRREDVRREDVRREDVRHEDVRHVAAWSAAATTVGDIPVSLLGPAVPGSLRRARSLVVGPAAAAWQAPIVRRALTPMSSWFSRPAVAPPMVSTMDRPPTVSRVATAGPLAQRPTVSLPALRSVADAVVRSSHPSNQPVAVPSPVLASRGPGSGPLGRQNRAVTSAAPGPMPSRLAEAPVPPLPMAAAFAQRASVDGSREMLPLVARVRASAAASRNAPAGRVPSVLAAFNAPLVRRSRFGATIAPAITASSSMLPMQSTHLRARVMERTLDSVAAPAAQTAASMTAGAMTAGAMRPSARLGQSAQAGSPALPRLARASATPGTADVVAADAVHGHDIRRSISTPEVASPLVPATVTPPLPGIAPGSAGARFLEALRERPADPLRPVPARFAPLARAIAGPRPVAVRSGPATTNALRRAGKRAATVDNVVHLAASPTSAPPSVEVFAHELVHAARPSPVPRFFDDDHHSPEEELARTTGNLMRAIHPPTIAGQGPAEFLRRQPGGDSRTPTFGTAGLAVGASGGLMSALAGASPPSPPTPRPDSTIRRTPAARPAAQRRKVRTTATSSAPSRSSSAALASSAGSNSPSTTIFRSTTGSGVVRRESASTLAGAPGSSIFSSGGPAGGNNDNGAPRGLAGLAAATNAVGQSANTLTNSTSPADNELIERIIDAIEERVIAELERRGRRHHPGVF